MTTPTQTFVRITGLSRLNVDAIRSTLSTGVGLGSIEVTSTTATFHMTRDEALGVVGSTIASLPGRGHPRASLYAVRRRLADATETTTPEEETMSKDEQTPATRKRNGRGAAAQSARTRKAAEKIEAHPVFAALSPEARATIAKNAPVEAEGTEGVRAHLALDAPEPVVELPERDATPADLAATVRAYVEEATEASIEIAAAPHHERWTVSGKTIAYVRIGARGASVEVKTPGETGPGKRTLVRNADEVGPVGRELAAVVQSLAAPAAPAAVA